MIDPDAVTIRGAGQLAVRCGPVLVWASSGPLEDAPLVELRQSLEQMASDHPQGVALLMIAIGEGELPTLQTRRRIIRGLSSLGDHLQAVAATFEGDATWLVQARSTFEGMFAQVEAAMLGEQFAMKVFGDREDAIVWLGEIVVGPDQRPISTEGFPALVDEVCARALED